MRFGAGGRGEADPRPTVKQAQLRQQKATLESSRTDAHLSQVNLQRETNNPTTSTPCTSLPRPSALRFRSLRRRGTTQPGCSSSRRHEPSPGQGPLPLRLHTSSRSRPGTGDGVDAVIIGDSIVWHIRVTPAKGKVRTRCLPGARVLDVAAQVPAVLNKNIKVVDLHAGTNDIRLRQTEILKKDFRSLVEKARTTSPTTRIIVSGPLPMFQRGIERLYRSDGLHPSRVGAVVLSDNISRTLRTI
ncbi:hypothetical protein QTP86_003029 [Hemibagrus guttatus]|nr:hypothetical protein QTP86_003029 [Hemibagrus guttatus]